MSYAFECYMIGGPWIEENPNCPIHGTLAQEAAQRLEIEAEKVGDYIASLRHSLATLERIVCHYGANYTEKGLPHPQQQAIDEARELLKKNLNDID